MNFKQFIDLDEQLNQGLNATGSQNMDALADQQKQLLANQAKTELSKVKSSLATNNINVNPNNDNLQKDQLNKLKMIGSKLRNQQVLSKAKDIENQLKDFNPQQQQQGMNPQAF